MNKKCRGYFIKRKIMRKLTAGYFLPRRLHENDDGARPGVHRRKATERPMLPVRKAQKHGQSRNSGKNAPQNSQKIPKF
jgi:hypothetical protein